MNEIRIISRSDAVSAGLKKYFTGKPCKHDHIAERWLSRHCTICLAASQKKWWGKNTGLSNKYAKDWRTNNRERWLETANHHTRLRRYKTRTPSWVDPKVIRAIYKECRRITKETGVPHEVDHTIPINGKNISGLHVPDNLQIITKEANRIKGNSWSACS